MYSQFLKKQVWFRSASSGCSYINRLKSYGAAIKKINVVNNYSTEEPCLTQNIDLQKGHILAEKEKRSRRGKWTGGANGPLYLGPPNLICKINLKWTWIRIGYILNAWVNINNGQMINDSIINSRAMCSGVLQGSMLGLV